MDTSCSPLQVSCPSYISRQVTFIKCGSCMHYDWCGAAHSHSQSTTDKPSQGDVGASLAPDLSLLSPELQQQWHVERNMHLGPIKITAQSGIKAVWQCHKCQAGQPHIWLAKVADRTQGSQCPYCSNKLVCSHNSLATTAPDAARCWNHSKNERSAEQVVAGSGLRPEWKCPTCNWEWQAPVFTRRRRNGCPKCNKKQPQPTFAEAQPVELAEWDCERNIAEGMHSENNTLGSNQQVHWVCSCCPRGQPHRWTAPPHSRMGDGTGCPVCAGQQTCVCNSLESLFPLFADDFDVGKNGFGPSEITAESNKEVWWRNAKHGSWRQSPHSRHYWRNVTCQTDQV